MHVFCAHVQMCMYVRISKRADVYARANRVFLWLPVEDANLWRLVTRAPIAAVDGCSAAARSATHNAIAA